MRTFNDVYLSWFANQSPDAAALLKIPVGDPNDGTALPRGLPALALVEKGVLVDMAIIVWGWEPQLVHLLKTNFGIPWIGNFTGFGPVADPNQAPMGVPQPWDYSKMPKGYLPSVMIDPTDDAGNLRRLDALYPPPPPPPNPNPVIKNPIGMPTGAWADYTAPDGTVYKHVQQYYSNSPVAADADGTKWTNPATGAEFILGVTQGLMGPTGLWYRIG